MLRSRLLLPIAAAALACPGAAAAAALPAGTTALVSGSPLLDSALPAPVNEARTGSDTVSADGRYVAFSSESDALMEGDDDDVVNVYVKDMQTGTVTLASRRTGMDGEPARGGCLSPALSDDGTRVAMVCGDLDGVDDNGRIDIYVRDIAAGTTVRASAAGATGVANDYSTSPAISGDGRHVAFVSAATNLDPAVTTAGTRVYRRDLQAGTTVVVSRKDASQGGAPAGGDLPSLSTDGTLVAYTSVAPLDPADSGSGEDVYVSAPTSGTTVLASRASGAGARGNGASTRPALAGDGSAVAFMSRASSFDPARDGDTAPNIYRRTLGGPLAGQVTALVDVRPGAKGVASDHPSISADGTLVAFTSEATGLASVDADPERDAYVTNMATGAVALASRGEGADGGAANQGARAVALSADGTFAAVGFAYGGVTADADLRQPSVILRALGAPHTTRAVARPAGDAPFVNAGGDATGASLSADGRFVAFASSAAGLGLPDDAVRGIFVRDRFTGAVVLASRADGVDGEALPGDVSSPVMSADGRRVAFVAADRRVLEAGKTDVYVRDLVTGRTWLASRADGAAGAPGNDDSSTPALDADGSRVAFHSRATNLGVSSQQIYVRDLDADQTILASRGDGPAGPAAERVPSAPSINADGTRVAFVSTARNLHPGDTDVVTDVFLRDLAASTTHLVSALPSGEKLNQHATTTTSLDAGGSRVAFASRATNVPDAGTDDFKVIVRDLAANTLDVVSRMSGPGGAVLPGSATDARLSPDGQFVAFRYSGAELGNPLPFVSQLYLRDIAGATTTLVSRRSGSDGAQATKHMFVDGVSTGGKCVGFYGGETLVGPRSDTTHSYVRALADDCGFPATPPEEEKPGDGDGGVDVEGGEGPKPSGDAGAPPTPSAPQPGPEPEPVTSNTPRGTVPTGDRTAPVVRGALLVRTGRRVTLRLRASEAATLVVTLKRAGRGRPVRVTRRVRAGAGSIALGRRARGRYRVTVVATDAAGNRSKPVALTLVVRRG